MATPIVRRSLAVFASFVLASGAVAQSVSFTGGSSSAATADASVLQAFDLTDGTVQELVLPSSSAVAFDVQLFIDGGWNTLHLWPHSLRAAGFQLLVQDETGTRPVAAPADVTFRGAVEGYPGSVVAASLIDGQLIAGVHLADGRPTWGIQPLTEALPAASASAHVVYDGGQVAIPREISCGLDDLIASGAPFTSPGGSSRSGSSRATKVAEIACDADFQFYQANGSSVTNTQNDITTVLNLVDVIYKRDVTIQYSVTTILVRTAEPDPYTSSSSSTLLGQFQSEWNSNQGAIVRDVAHLFTGRNLSGTTIGVAYLGVVCIKSSAYGLSESRFTTNLTSRAGLTAHELGHNWNASHCSGSGCKIMCSGLGGCSGIISSFGTTSINSITSFKNSRGCLGSPNPPLLLFVNPGSVTAYAGGQITLTGATFSGADSIDVGGKQLYPPVGFQVVDDNKITFFPPTATSIGIVPVTVSNSAGPSNALNLNYVPTSPPKLVVTGTGVGGFNFVMNFGSDPNDFYATIAAISDPTTIPFLGSNILASGFVIDVGQLDAVGIGKTTIVPPMGVLVGLTVYTQMGSIEETTGGFNGASNIGSTVFFL